VVGPVDASLRLRPLTASDESAFLAGDRLMRVEGFAFALGYEVGTAWDEYLRRLESKRLGQGLDPDEVPSTLLVADVAGEIVGRVSVRHHLNAFLAHQGGHIGFGVLPGHRRRGYASRILVGGLDVARALGIDRVLVTCDDDNIGSATVIERGGGVLDSTVESSHGVAVRRYWIG
jgi:predicted acetyltransferase